MWMRINYKPLVYITLTICVFLFKKKNTGFYLIQHNGWNWNNLVVFDFLSWLCSFEVKGRGDKSFQLLRYKHLLDQLWQKYFFKNELPFLK